MNEGTDIGGGGLALCTLRFGSHWEQGRPAGGPCWVWWGEGQGGAGTPNCTSRFWSDPGLPQHCLTSEERGEHGEKSRSSAWRRPPTPSWL